MQNFLLSCLGVCLLYTKLPAKLFECLLCAGLPASYDGAATAVGETVGVPI